MTISKLVAFFADDSGASMVEYSLIAALVAVGAIGVLGEVGTSLEGTLTTVRDGLQ